MSISATQHLQGVLSVFLFSQMFQLFMRLFQNLGVGKILQGSFLNFSLERIQPLHTPRGISNASLLSGEEEELKSKTRLK